MVVFVGPGKNEPYRTFELIEQLEQAEPERLWETSLIGDSKGVTDCAAYSTTSRVRLIPSR